MRTKSTTMKSAGGKPPRTQRAKGDAKTTVAPSTATAAPKAAPKTKASTDANPAATGSSGKGSTKRKAEDETEDEPQTNGVKRHKAKSVTPAAEPAQKQNEDTVVGTQAVALKKARAKKVINHPPTQKLDIYCFGEGSSGELGLGPAKNCISVKRPRLNALLDAHTVGVVSLDVGGMHTAALTHGNKILTWGVNDQGALGRNTSWEGGLRDIDDDKSDSDSDSGSESAVNPHESTPGEIDLSNVPDGTVFTQLACTDSATFALTDEGLVYGWGTFRSNEGIFGFSPTTVIQRIPTLVDSLKKITQLAAGANHVLALDSTGAVFAWGSGQQNQLGRRILERTKLNSLRPTQFGLPKKMVRVGAGAYHSFAVGSNGAVYSWGLNSFGETGISKAIGEDGGEADVHHPTVIEALEGKGTVTCIQGGSHHSAAVTDKNELFVWGRLDGFQLGIKISDLPEKDVIRDSHGKPRILKNPVQVPDLKASYVAASSDHCIAITIKGQAYAWGFSTTYQTGLGTDDDVEVATLIDNTAVRGKKLVWAGAGGQFSIIAGIPGEKPLVNGVKH